MDKNERLLEHLKEVGSIMINVEALESVWDFNCDKEINSLESAVLVMSGHQPLKERVFSKSEFEEWCDINGIEYYLNAMYRNYYLKYIK